MSTKERTTWHTTEYTATTDPFSDDPRNDDYLSPMYTFEGQNTDEPPENLALAAFHRLYSQWRHWKIPPSRQDRFAADVVNRWLHIFHPDEPRRVYLRSMHGYMQSDWWTVAVLAESEDEATQDAHILEMWLRNDVWCVAEESVTSRICDMGHTHETRDTEELVGGIFAESEEQAIAIFKEGR